MLGRPRPPWPSAPLHGAARAPGLLLLALLPRAAAVLTLDSRARVDPEHFTSQFPGYPWAREAGEQELKLQGEAEASCAILPSAAGSGGSHGEAPALEDGVVVFLVTRQLDFKYLVKLTFKTVFQHFLQHRPYPVVIFVPSAELRAYDPASFGDSIPASTVREAVAAMRDVPEGYDLRVEEFGLKFPDVIEGDATWKRKMNGCASSVGTSYKHMNQFFTKVMYEHPALNSYRYYMRLDVDILFRSDLPTDPFCMINRLGKAFVFQNRHHVRSHDCSAGMWSWFQQYAAREKLVARDPNNFFQEGGNTIYTGYIGVGDLDFFRSDEVMRLARAFNDDGRVYLNRWSDQTYYVLLLALFREHSSVGNVGLQWPAEVFCHKCQKRIPREGEELLAGGTDDDLLAVGNASERLLPLRIPW